MSSPLLSIVTVTKDDAVGLAWTLASARSLRAVGTEHLVIDGVTVREDEETAQIAAQDDGKIISIARPPKGIADAFNAGISVAQGEWVWFLNGGDSVDPGLDSKNLRKVLENSGADILIGGLTYEGESGPRSLIAEAKRWPPLRAWIPHPATLVRRRLFEQFGKFDERYTIAMDYEWFLRVLTKPVVVEVISMPLAIFAPNGVSQRADLFSRIACEQNDAIRRHHLRLWSLSPYVLYRLVRAFLSTRLSAVSK